MKVVSSSDVFVLETSEMGQALYLTIRLFETLKPGKLQVVVVL